MPHRFEIRIHTPRLPIQEAARPNTARNSLTYKALALIAFVVILLLTATTTITIAAAVGIATAAILVRGAVNRLVPRRRRKSQ